MAVEQGSVIKDCRIDLPGAGVVNCDAQIVRVFETPHAGKQRLWIGCQFLRLPGSAGTLLQRYILQLERARLARSRGLKNE
jgi:c-di-GMP-binding flagellar brake protein YcgR